jgi:hypothetical protein
MLCNEEKWNDKLLEVRSTPIIAKVVAAAAVASNIQHDNENVAVERSEGRDSAKNDSKRKTLHHPVLWYKCCSKYMIEK